VRRGSDRETPDPPIADQRQQRARTGIGRGMAGDPELRVGCLRIKAFDRQQHRLTRNAIDQPQRGCTLRPDRAFGQR